MCTAQYSGLTMLSHWTKWVLYPVGRSEPSGNLYTGCQSLQSNRNTSKRPHITNQTCFHQMHHRDWKHLDWKPCWSMWSGVPPIEATESTRNRQLYLQTQSETTTCSHLCAPAAMETTVRYVESYLWHSSPMPSKGCKTPVEDSPCARKKSAGLCRDKACGEVIEITELQLQLPFVSWAWTEEYLLNVRVGHVATRGRHNSMYCGTCRVNNNSINWFFTSIISHEPLD